MNGDDIQAVIAIVIALLLAAAGVLVLRQLSPDYEQENIP